MSSIPIDYHTAQCQTTIINKHAWWLHCVLVSFLFCLFKKEQSNLLICSNHKDELIKQNKKRTKCFHKTQHYSQQNPIEIPACLYLQRKLHKWPKGPGLSISFWNCWLSHGAVLLLLPVLLSERLPPGLRVGQWFKPRWTRTRIGKVFFPRFRFQILCLDKPWNSCGEDHRRQ